MFELGKYWRDKSGNVVCPGDSCKHNCSEKCPIWLNTLALQKLMCNDAHSAAKMLQKAVDIEPLFSGAYNNLGAAYGMIGEYDKSINAYKMKLKLVPNDCDALYGVAVSCKNAGKYTEALKYCEHYKTAGGNESQIESVIKVCKEKTKSKKSQNTSEIKSWADYLDVILKEEAESGHIDYRGGMPHIPEIMIQASDTVTALDKIEEERDMPAELRIQFGCAWSAYAAMAMVEIWNSNFANFKIKNMIFDILEPRGFAEMDEYVYEILGIEFKGNDKDPLRKQLLSIVNRHKDWYLEGNKANYDNYINLAKAMFNYGMIYQMARIGMH